MKKKEERLEKQMADLTAENKRLTEPLQHAREEVEELRKSLANYEKDKQCLKVKEQFCFFCMTTPPLLLLLLLFNFITTVIIHHNKVTNVMSHSVHRKE